MRCIIIILGIICLNLRYIIYFTISLYQIKRVDTRKLSQRNWVIPGTHVKFPRTKETVMGHGIYIIIRFERIAHKFWKCFYCLIKAINNMLLEKNVCFNTHPTSYESNKAYMLSDNGLIRKALNTLKHGEREVAGSFF